MSLKSVILVFVGAVIVGAIFYLNSHKADVRGTNVRSVEVTSGDEISNSTLVGALHSSTTSVSSSAIKTSLMSLVSADKSKGYVKAKEITTPDGFINTPGGLPISISQYIGKKIVLIDFWTYSCINCQRTTPYLNAWYDKYEKDGLVIIGIHTPEFDFEKIYDNVTKAVTKEGIKYPVVLDNDYSTWTAYQNQYWPRRYLIDMAGYVIYDHIGEGAYDETERKIQDLIIERKNILGYPVIIDTTISKPKNVVTSIETQSPETYFGSSRNQYLANGKKGVNGTQNFTLPDPTTENTLNLGGFWNIFNQYAEAKGDVSIIYKFNAKEVYFVAGSEIGTDIEVLLDSKPVIAKGVDVETVSGKTIVHIKDNRIYHLIDLPHAEGHTLEIRGKSGLKAFTFTFG